MNEMNLHAGGYTFYLRETIDADDQTIELAFVSKKKHIYPCVRIELDTRPSKTIAYLQSVQYDDSCNTKPLEKRTGTILMIQVALKYTIEKYTYVKQIHLQDETFTNIPGKPLITARRLLNGQPGWYEEYLHAIPATEPLKKTLRYLRKPDTIARVKSLLPPESTDVKWWSPDHIYSIAEQVKQCLFSHLIGSPWVLSKKTIQAYDVAYTESSIAPRQLGGFRRRLNTALSSNYMNPINRHQYHVEIV